jgi:hypothetical protein
MTDLNLQRIPAEDQSDADESTLEQIRGLYRKAQGELRLTLPVPGDMGKLVKVRYEPRDDFETVEGRSARDTNLDYLIHLCDCILIRTGGSWKPLTEDGEPVGFFPTALNELLGVNVPTAAEGGTARAAVLALFAGAPLPHAAAGDHVLRITRWLQTGEARVDEEELLGEF